MPNSSAAHTTQVPSDARGRLASAPVGIIWSAMATRRPEPHLVKSPDENHC